MTTTRKTPYRTPAQRRQITAPSTPLPDWLGLFAGTRRPHRFRPLGATQCALCFGWYDDVRHR